MKRWIVFTIIGLALLALYVPRISAERFREPIRHALESALGREVKVGTVQFRLLPMPGFTVHDVVIGEDPAIGREPAAYVTTLRARPRISALLGGPLAFASVDLEETSVNLTRIDHGQSGVRWNFTSLMKPELLTTFPSIHMIGGRINFKFGDTKSVFYLLSTDVDLWPPTESNGPWTLRVRAEPARTDRPARGFGSLTARGQWIPHDSAFTLDVKLEKSELGDMLTLVQGRESGLHGHIWGDAHLGGPLNRIGLTGRVTVDDIHLWNQPPLPGAASWPMALGGSINLPGQVIEVRATAAGASSPFDLRYRVADYLGYPRWATTMQFNGMPLSPLPGICRSLGLNIPVDVTLAGTAQGAVTYSVPDGVPLMDGQVRIEGTSIQTPGRPPLRVAGTLLRFAQSSLTLEPATITNQNNETATLEGRYDASLKRLAVSLTSEGMSISSLTKQIPVAGAPLLGQATSGTWAGHLQYSSDGGGTESPWRGEFQLKDADIPFEAFNQAIHVFSADAVMDESGISLKRLNVAVSGIAAQGEYRYETGADHPHRFRLSLTRADGDTLERVLQPTLHRGNFLNYAFNFGRVPEPDWMRSIRAEGAIQIASLDLGPEHFTKIKTHVVWEGSDVTLSALQGQLEKAAFAGEVVVDLAQRQPQYHVTGKVSGLPWRTGVVEAEGSLKTSGTGSELLPNMTADGAFRAHRIDLASLETWDSIAGRFALAWNLRNPSLTLTQLVMSTGGDTYTGTAETRDGGDLVLRVTDGAKHIQAAGALLRGDDLKLIGQ